MAERLDVFFGTRLVGALHPRAGGAVAFAYAAGWLEAEASFAISAALPLAPGLATTTAAHAFFAGLLPEGQVREAVARLLGLSAANDYALLEAIGGDCAGALTILPAGAVPDGSTGAYEPLDPSALSRMARGAGVLAEVSGARRARLSLAGAQDKLPVRVDRQGRLWLPVAGAPSTHILKIPSRGFKHLAANETLVTTLARARALGVVDVDLHRVDDVEVALVRRYDRLVDDAERVTRLHQEDLCQALGLHPSTKYEQEGGPGFVHAMTVARERSSEPLVDAQRLLRWIVFDLLAGNADGHGKNLSFLRSADGRTVRLAPFYDLVCTRVYPRLDRSLAMGVGGERDPGQVARRHWEALAGAVGVGAGVVLREVERQAASLVETFDAVAAAHAAAHGPAPIVRRLRDVLRRQCRRTRELL
jgi:serine/threonine-protein kinase HipA